MEQLIAKLEHCGFTKVLFDVQKNIIARKSMSNFNKGFDVRP